MRIFDYLKAVTIDKTDLDFEDEEVKKDYSQRMMNRWISMNEVFIPMINKLNRCKNLPDEIHYKYLLAELPQRKLYFNYINKEDENVEQVKRMICKYFKCSLKESVDYLHRLNDDEIQSIIDAFSYGRSGNDLMEI